MRGSKPTAAGTARAFQYPKWNGSSVDLERRALIAHHRSGAGGRSGWRIHRQLRPSINTGARARDRGISALLRNFFVSRLRTPEFQVSRNPTLEQADLQPARPNGPRPASLLDEQGFLTRTSGDAGFTWDRPTPAVALVRQAIGATRLSRGERPARPTKPAQQERKALARACCTHQAQKGSSGNVLFIGKRFLRQRRNACGGNADHTSVAQQQTAPGFRVDSPGGSLTAVSFYEPLRELRTLSPLSRSCSSVTPTAPWPSTDRIPDLSNPT